MNLLLSDMRANQERFIIRPAQKFQVKLIYSRNRRTLSKVRQVERVIDKMLLD